MTAGIHQWLLSIVAAALLLALAEGLTPVGTAKRVGRLLGGVLLCLTMLRPLYTLDVNALADALAESAMAQADLEEISGDISTAPLSALISEQSEAYIQNAAAELGISCTAQVTCAEWDGVMVPAAVVISGTWTEEARAALEEKITENLAIVPEQQTYREGES